MEYEKENRSLGTFVVSIRFLLVSVLSSRHTPSHPEMRPL